MNTQEKHTLFRLRWDSSFDDEKNGVALQSRLSQWSSTFLHREAELIFNRFCPPGLVLRIDSLILDLGEIPYSSLEEFLQIRFRETLTRHLTDIILYPHRGNEHLVIEDKHSSQIKALRYYLEKGYLPWTHRGERDRIGQMVEEQAKKNFSDFILIIRQTGQQEEARRRIAWQFEERLLKKTLEGLEPYNHKQISDFSDELTNIQAQNAIVKTSSRALKKNIWFWILTHLLTNRGAIFNQRVFARDTLKQMAQHYNVKYAELLFLIRNAVERIRQNSYLKADFFVLLDFLIQDVDVGGQNTGSAPQKIELDMARLEETVNHSITNPNDLFSAGSPPPAITEVNEWLLRLCRSTPHRLRTYLTQSPDARKWMKSQIDVLDQPTFAAVLKSLHAEGSGLLLEILAWFSKSKGATDPGFPAKARGTAYDVLQSTITAPFDPDRMVINYLAKLEDRLPGTAKSLLQRLHQNHKGAPINPTDTLGRMQKALFALGSESSDSPIPGATSGPAHPEYQMLRAQSGRVLYLPQAVLRGMLQEGIGSGKMVVRAGNEFIHLGELFLWSIEFDLPEMRKYFARLRMTEKIATTLQNALPPANLSHSLPRTVPASWKTGLDALAGWNAALQQLKIKTSAGLPLLASWTFISQMISAGNYSPPLLKELIATSRPQIHQTLPRNEAEARKALRQLNLTPTLAKALRQQDKRLHELWEATPPSLHKQPAQPIRPKTAALPSAVVRLVETLHQVPEAPKRTLLEFESFLLAFRAIELPGQVFSHLERALTSLLERVCGQKEWQLLAPDRVWSFLGETARREAGLTTEAFLNKALVFANQFPSGFASSIRQLTEKSAFTDIKKASQEGKIPAAVIPRDQLLAQLRACFENEGGTASKNQSSTPFPKLLLIGLESIPEAMRELLHSNLSQMRVQAMVRQAVPLSTFAALLFADAHQAGREQSQALIAWLQIADLAAGADLMDDIEAGSWTFLFELIVTGNASSSAFEHLIGKQLRALKKEAGWKTLGSSRELSVFESSIPALLQTIFSKHDVSFISPAKSPAPITPSDGLLACQERKQLEILTLHLLCQAKAPDWYLEEHPETPEKTLAELLRHFPSLFRNTLRKCKMSEIKSEWIWKTMGFDGMRAGIAAVDPGVASLLVDIDRFQANLDRLATGSVSADELRLRVFRNVLQAWQSGRREGYSPVRIWQEILWELQGKRRIEARELMEQIGNSLAHFPSTFQSAFQYLRQKGQGEARPEARQLLRQKAEEKGTEGIPIFNAGLVLMSNYIPVLFDRLDVVNDKDFSNPADRLKAVHHLQFLATGLSETEEPELPLNKVLCGLSLTDPVPAGLEHTAEQIEMMEGLIEAVITYWTAIGTTSVEGFRGNWLVREGILSEQTDRWELHVEKRVYDLLINRSPFSYSIIKYPWMVKPLHVTWPC